MTGLVEVWGRVNWVDAVVFVILVRTLFIGFKRGFILELTALIGLLIAFVISLQYASSLSLLVSKWVHIPPKWLQALSVVLLFFGTYFVVHFVRLGMGKVFHLELVSTFDRWGGALVGLLRAGVLSSLVLLVLSGVPFPVIEKEIKENSLTGSYVIQIMPKVYEIWNGVMQWQFHR